MGIKYNNKKYFRGSTLLHASSPKCCNLLYIDGSDCRGVVRCFSTAILLTSVLPATFLGPYLADIQNTARVRSSTAL